MHPSHVSTQITSILPEDSWNIHYRDDIGNISTSNVYRSSDGFTVLNMEPRFYLWGNWKNQFQVSYNTEAKGYIEEIVSRRSFFHRSYIFSTELGPSFSGASSESQTKIILPNGARDISAICDRIVEIEVLEEFSGVYLWLDLGSMFFYGFQQMRDILLYFKSIIDEYIPIDNYVFDIKGLEKYSRLFSRPVVEFRAKNILNRIIEKEKENEKVEKVEKEEKIWIRVIYTVPVWSITVKPLILIFYYLILILSVVAYPRLVFRKDIILKLFPSVHIWAAANSMTKKAEKTFIGISRMKADGKPKTPQVEKCDNQSYEKIYHKKSKKKKT